MNAHSRVGEVVAHNIGTVAIFQRHGIDFCCGGKRTLADAAAEVGLDVEVLVEELDAVANGTQDTEAVPSWEGGLADLCEHIVQEFHEPLRIELGRLMQLAIKVVRVHGERHPETLPGIGRTLHRLGRELHEHMTKEEQVLFPWIASIERGDGNRGCDGISSDATLQMPVEVMEMEHQQAAGMLAELNRLTDGYRPPEGACTSFRALYDGLHRLEQAMHLHVHLENNVLFPRALQQAEAVSTQP